MIVMNIEFPLVTLTPPNILKINFLSPFLSGFVFQKIIFLRDKISPVQALASFALVKLNLILILYYPDFFCFFIFIFSDVHVSSKLCWWKF